MLISIPFASIVFSFVPFASPFAFIRVGHFHPVLVHLPIGIIFIAFILHWIERRTKNTQLRYAITVSLLAGMLGAIASCITGLMLASGADYDAEAVAWHQWAGIATALFSIFLYYIYQKNKLTGWQWPVMIVLFLGIIITGHFGGSLTHGSGYLAQAFTNEPKEATEKKPIPDVQEALVYNDVIQPLLEEKCYSCHNANKKKGGLRLDDSAFIMQGGKEGLVINPGNAAESELIKRILLPAEDEDHMPPKEKGQLSEHDIALLHWWINSGTSFAKKVKELEQTETVQPALLALQQGPEKKAAPDIPEKPVGKANETAIQKLRATGVVVLPVAENSNYLLANFVTTDTVTLENVQLLAGIKEQLVWLKIENTSIGDSALQVMGQCKNLTRLQIAHTRVTDEGLKYLQNLAELRYLNLVGTNVTANGIKQLTGLPKLHSLYLYQTKVSKENWAELEKQFPNTKLDSGGYVVPVLETDTTVLRYTPSQ